MRWVVLSMVEISCALAAGAEKRVAGSGFSAELSGADTLASCLSCEMVVEGLGVSWPSLASLEPRPAHQDLLE